MRVYYPEMVHEHQAIFLGISECPAQSINVSIVYKDSISPVIRQPYQPLRYMAPRVTITVLNNT